MSNRKIGFITSIPFEVIYAAECIPVDLNNLFIQSENPNAHINQAEDFGFPRNYCSWIKGTFQILREYNIRTVITVGEGECSGSLKQAELLRRIGIECIMFSYPHSRSREALQHEIKRLMHCFKVDQAQVDQVKSRIDEIRDMLRRVDTASYTRHCVSGQENFEWLISSTDVQGNIAGFHEKVSLFYSMLDQRDPVYEDHVRIGVIGIPPIATDIFSIIEHQKGIVVYNEIPRQFSMPSFEKGLTDQYLDFTYPYDISLRINDIRENIRLRNIDGIINYSQSFCPRQIDDIVLKQEIDIPMITIECDRPGRLDERNVIRIEAFLERWK